MYIYELEKDDVVNIRIEVDGKKHMEIQSTIIGTSEVAFCALLEPIRYENKILNFSSDCIKLTAEAVVGNKPFIWRGCMITLVTYGKVKYHALICKNRGVSVNRRQAFRVPVTEEGSVNNGSRTVDATCIDVSSTGFSFVTDNYDSIPMENVVLNYHDNLLDIDVQLSGVVVRKEKRENNKTLFGCRIMTAGAIADKLAKYISDRQRKMVKRK